MASLGIPWVLGFVPVDSIKLYSQSIFCFTIPFQGLVIFIVRVLLRADAREAWKSFLKTGSLRKPLRNYSSTTRTYSSTQNNISLTTSSTNINPSSLITLAALPKLSINYRLTMSIHQKSFDGNANHKIDQNLEAFNEKSKHLILQDTSKKRQVKTTVDKNCNNDEKPRSYLWRDKELIQNILKNSRKKLENKSVKPDLIENLQEGSINIEYIDDRKINEQDKQKNEYNKPRNDSVRNESASEKSSQTKSKDDCSSYCSINLNQNYKRRKDSIKSENPNEKSNPSKSKEEPAKYCSRNINKKLPQYSNENTNSFAEKRSTGVCCERIASIKEPIRKISSNGDLPNSCLNTQSKPSMKMQYSQYELNQTTKSLEQLNRPISPSSHKERKC